MTENLIINGVDHSAFNLEWAKRGGVLFITEYSEAVKLLSCNSGDLFEFCDKEDPHVFGYGMESHETYGLPSKNFRMATPAECEAAGIEYIEYQGWRPIENAPKDGDIILCCNEKWYFSNHGEITLPQIVFWDGVGFVIDHTYDDDNPQYFNPTLWQPLPLPPKDE